MLPRLRLLTIITVVTLVLDQWTKQLILSRFSLYESVTVLENFFHITYVRNKGAAFGIFADSAFRIPFFITVSTVAVVGILWYLLKTEHHQKWFQAALSLIFAGAIGNLIDRIRFGEVIDFLDAHWYQHHWPAFNVADSAICIGVGILLVDMFLDERRKKQSEKGH